MAQDCRLENSLTIAPKASGSLADDHNEASASPGPPKGEPLARLSVSVPRSLYRQIRLLAHDQDSTLTALIVRLIREELQGKP